MVGPRLRGKIDLEVFKIGRFIMMACLLRDLIMGGSILVSIVSYIVFTFLDLLDPLLYVVYKLIGYVFESEWSPFFKNEALHKASFGITTLCFKSIPCSIRWLGWI